VTDSARSEYPIFNQNHVNGCGLISDIVGRGRNRFHVDFRNNSDFLVWRNELEPCGGGACPTRPQSVTSLEQPQTPASSIHDCGDLQQSVYNRFISAEPRVLERNMPLLRDLFGPECNKNQEIAPPGRSQGGRCQDLVRGESICNINSNACIPIMPEDMTVNCSMAGDAEVNEESCSSIEGCMFIPAGEDQNGICTYSPGCLIDGQSALELLLEPQNPVSNSCEIIIPDGLNLEMGTCQSTMDYDTSCRFECTDNFGLSNSQQNLEFNCNPGTDISYPNCVPLCNAELCGEYTIKSGPLDRPCLGDDCIQYCCSAHKLTVKGDNLNINPNDFELSYIEIHNNMNDYKTFRCYIKRIRDSNYTFENIYSLSSSSTNLAPMELPPCYQVDFPFGQNVGGVNSAYFRIANNAALGFAEYDSWLTVGMTDGDARGELGNIGIDFALWNEHDPLIIDSAGGGAIFWMNPDNGPEFDEEQYQEHGIPLGQFTIPVGKLPANFKGLLQGRTSQEGEDAQVYFEFNIQ
jgi:hypothetical protein